MLFSMRKMAQRLAGTVQSKYLLQVLKMCQNSLLVGLGSLSSTRLSHVNLKKLEVVLIRIQS